MSDHDPLAGASIAAWRRVAARPARALGVLAVALVVTANAGPAVAQAAAPAQQALVAQKLKLVEQLLATPRMREAESAGDDAARAALARARDLLAQGRTALDTGDLTQAEASTNEALKLVSAGGQARPSAAAALERREAQQRYAELEREIHAYRGALADAVARGKAAAHAPKLAEVDRVVDEARQSAAAGRLVDAQRAMAQAQQTIVRALAEARAGETVTIELKFDSPQAEFAHEMRRYEHHWSLLETALAEYKPQGVPRERVDLEVVQARAVKDRAQASAAAGRHDVAIREIEQATAHLVRALEAAGMPALR